MSELGNQLSSISKIIKNDGVAIIPTETVYGLACSPFSAKAIERIYEIKKRDLGKPLALLFSSVMQMKNFAIIENWQNKIIEQFSPGPVTYLLNKKPDSAFSQNLNHNEKKIAMRIPDHKFVLELLNELNFPIVATSVNISGEPPAISACLIDDSIIEKVDFIYDGGPSKLKTPSTIIDISSSLDVKIIREGCPEVTKAVYDFSVNQLKNL